MKSLAELQAIRDKMKNAINVREGDGDKIRVVVGMATCGIAAGARPVLNCFTDGKTQSFKCKRVTDRLYRHLPV